MSKFLQSPWTVRMFSRFGRTAGGNLVAIQLDQGDRNRFPVVFDEEEPHWFVLASHLTSKRLPNGDQWRARLTVFVLTRSGEGVNIRHGPLARNRRPRSGTRASKYAFRMMCLASVCGSLGHSVLVGAGMDLNGSRDLLSQGHLVPQRPLQLPATSLRSSALPTA